MNASKHRADVEQTSSKRGANVEQLARVFWIHLLDVRSMFARSCKRGISRQGLRLRHCTDGL